MAPSVTAHFLASVLACFALITLAATSKGESSDLAKNRIVVLKERGLSEMQRRYSGMRSMGARAQFNSNALRHHDKLLAKVGGKMRGVRKLHDYTNLVSGFSAMLTDKQAKAMQDDPDVLYVFEDKKLQLYTTRSFSFLGLNATKGAWQKTKGTDVIIGVIDTGIWPEDPSFSDAGFGPVPKKFKGICNAGDGYDDFKCNRKLIGARYFGEGFAASQRDYLESIVGVCGDFLSPRDLNGHGSHSSGIAAGSATSATVLQGSNYGRASGVAYGARIAAYKVFWCGGGGMTSDIVAAMDAALSDGVDVLSMSLGGGPDEPGIATGDPVTLAAFFATLAGVPVVFAAGNSGPGAYTASNAAPWLLTVAAGTLDRKFTSAVVLGNKLMYKGQSAMSPGTPSAVAKKYYPLVSAADAPRYSNAKADAMYCRRGYLNSTRVRGKVVLCLRGKYTFDEKAAAVRAMGGVGMILYNEKQKGSQLESHTFSVPTVHITYNDGLAVKEYIKNAKKPVAYLQPTQGSVGVAVREAPSVAAFSSAGPNGGSLNILKPDITAPGENIISAWSQSPFADISSSAWQIVSGTSMACPHVAGAVALLKAVYPTWKPSMYFSALMTTASLKTNRNRAIRAVGGKIATPFQMGAGHLNPNAAMYPGLVYSISNAGYKTFLCSPDSGINETYSGLSVFDYCPRYPSTRALDLNLPSVTFYNQKGVAKTRRTLTNVGPVGTYFVSVSQPSGAKLKVWPTKLTFAKGQSRSYSITSTPSQRSSSVKGATVTKPPFQTSPIQKTIAWTFGSVMWYNNKGHRVRINVAVNSV